MHVSTGRWHCWRHPSARAGPTTQAVRVSRWQRGSQYRRVLADSEAHAATAVALRDERAAVRIRRLRASTRRHGRRSPHAADDQLGIFVASQRRTWNAITPAQRRGVRRIARLTPSLSAPGGARNAACQRAARSRLRQLRLFAWSRSADQLGSWAARQPRTQLNRNPLGCSKQNKDFNRARDLARHRLTQVRGKTLLSRLSRFDVIQRVGHLVAEDSR